MSEYILPEGHAKDILTEGCIVLEGGAFRGLYTQGVLDVLMQEDINMSCTIGVSAGALGGMNYVAGQIGRSARVNLRYRHESDYIGIGALKRDHGITGFSYLFNEISWQDPLDMERFNDPRRRFVVTATDIETGENEFFEKGICSDMFTACAASASVPYISEAVELEGGRYLDGGIACRIPFQWALDQGYEKVIVVRTRDRDYRKRIHMPLNLTRVEYHRYPALKAALDEESARYNVLLDRLDMLEESGRIFVITPSQPVEIRRFEGDLDALYELYQLGRKDAEERLAELKAYLNR